MDLQTYKKLKQETGEAIVAFGESKTQFALIVFDGDDFTFGGHRKALG